MIQVDDDKEKEQPDNDRSFWKLIAVIGLILQAIGYLIALIK